MAKEIELKLALPLESQRVLLRHPLLKSASHKTTAVLDNIYYDTPALVLKRSGVVVRRRRQGGVWLQTVKCAGTVAAGLAARPEWESPFSGDFDFSGIDDASVRHLLDNPAVRAELLPAFQTLFRRTTWHFPGVLLMLDRGWIIADGRREPICEVELELDGGDLADLFSLADALAMRCPLLPAPLSKAERGFALRSHVAPQPMRATEIRLSADMSPDAAFRAVALACLNHVQANCAGAIDSDDPEYLHQLRVGIRRLKAAWRTFAPILDPKSNAAIPTALTDVMRQAGRARDLDILQTEIFEPARDALTGLRDTSALGALIDERRALARQHVRQHVASREFGQALIRLSALLHSPAPLTGNEQGDLEHFVHHRLRTLQRKALRLARHAHADDPSQLHALRIGIKRLRYAHEFFASLPGTKAQRRLARNLPMWQTVLGELNDLTNAGPLLLDCAGRDLHLGAAVTALGQWHIPRYKKLRIKANKLLTALRRHAR